MLYVYVSMDRAQVMLQDCLIVIEMSFFLSVHEPCSKDGVPMSFAILLSKMNKTYCANIKIVQA